MLEIKNTLKVKNTFKRLMNKLKRAEERVRQLLANHKKLSNCKIMRKRIGVKNATTHPTAERSKF